MSGLALVLYDETTDGRQLNKVELRLVSQAMTLRDLISQRIKQEVDEYNHKQQEVFQGLVQPTDTEAVLNGYRMHRKRKISYDNQLEKAVRAFESNGFFVLLDDRQVEDLDEPLVFTEHSHVSFVKLVPLVGG